MENKRCQFGISVSSMIVGNPKAGRAMATIAIALFFLILLTAAFVCWRKRTDPEKEPPLHPSTLIAALRYRLELGDQGGGMQGRHLDRGATLPAGTRRDFPQLRQCL